MWIDAHCHLQWEGVIPNALNRAVESGVDRVICVGTDSDTSRQAVELSVAAGERIKATVGLHPHDAINGLESTIAVLDEAIASHDGTVVAIGECGLDYFYGHSPRNIQKEVFIRQIHLAKQHDLALVIHTRDAWDDTFEILRSEGVPPRTVMHCFTGSPKEAEICLELGTYLSFSGIVTFPKAKDVQLAAQICPLDRMTIETDSPYLTPVPYRGKPNEPALVPVIGKFISELKNVQVEEFAMAVSGTTEELFNLRSL